MRLVCHDCIWALSVIFSQPFSLQERFRLGDEVILMESRRANQSADAQRVQTILRTPQLCKPFCGRPKSAFVRLCSMQTILRTPEPCKPFCGRAKSANHFADGQSVHL